MNQNIEPEANTATSGMSEAPVAPETDAVTAYLKKDRKKKIITIISLILVALLAVAGFLKFHKTKNLKIESIKWDISADNLKFRCRAKLNHESDDGFISYDYSSIEGIKGNYTVFYNFENDKLSSVRVDVEGNHEKFKEKFNMKNVSYDGTNFYAEYKGYHLYLWTLPGTNLSNIYANNMEPTWNLSIKKEKDHDESIEYPTNEELEEIKKVLPSAAARATSISIVNPSTITSPDEFRIKYTEYVDSFEEISQLYSKYPKNSKVLNSMYNLTKNERAWTNKAEEMLDVVDASKKAEYKAWLNDCLERLIASLELISD